MPVWPSTTTTYTYNASGQLAGVATPSMSAKYSYGISGMREAKTVASAGTTSSTTSLWAGMQLVAERDLDGTTYRYLYGPRGAPLELSVTASGGVATSYAYQLDHAGSVIALTSATGTVVASYAYDPWGNPTSVGGTNPTLAARQPLRYRGYYWDGESSLYYMPARYYDPSVGRFISADPAAPSAGSPLSLNRYVYCEGDPVQGSDPSGAIADYDGTGKSTTVNSALHASRHAKNMHARAYFRNKGVAAYYSKQLAGRIDKQLAAGRMIGRDFGRLEASELESAIAGADLNLFEWQLDRDGTSYGRGNFTAMPTRPGEVEWACAIAGTFADGLGWGSGALGWVLGAMADVGISTQYYGPKVDRGEKSRGDELAAGASAIPMASTVQLIAYILDAANPGLIPWARTRH